MVDRAAGVDVAPGLWGHLRDLPTEGARLEATVAAMRELARGREGMLSPYVRGWALAATRGLCSHPDDSVCLGGSIYRAAVGDLVSFRRDPLSVELVASPEFTLEAGGGDCDDLSTLLAAGLLTLGLPAWFVLGGLQPDPPRHVLAATIDRPGALYPLDLSLSVREPGRWPPAFRVGRVVQV